MAPFGAPNTKDSVKLPEVQTVTKNVIESAAFHAALRTEKREFLPPLCWDDCVWKTKDQPPAVKELPKEERVEVKNEKPSKARAQRQLAPMSFQEITAQFERVLKPYYGMFAVEGAAAPGQEVYDMSGDCYHPLLAVEPSNPSTPPRSFKIHRERTVIRPGYTYVEPVLLDLPVNPLKLSNKGIQNILHMTHNMKPLPPRIDNFTHHPPSDLLYKPPCYVPNTQSTSFKQPLIPAQPCVVHSGSGSSCSHASKKMSI